MNSQLSDFLRNAVLAAITPVEKFQARCAKLLFSTVDGAPKICVVIDYVGGRHGCGSEQDGFWAHSNDGDSAVFAQDYRLSLVNHTASLLFLRSLRNWKKSSLLVKLFPSGLSFTRIPVIRIFRL